MTGGGSSWNGNGGLLNAGIAAGGLFAPLGVGQALGLGKGIYDQLSYGGCTCPSGVSVMTEPESSVNCTELLNPCHTRDGVPPLNNGS